jgi:hypothetical protein|tara:strand:+ start:1733 stop:2164 length:432 start_codon:yes stop_codon:yes gene_type:complete
MKKIKLNITLLLIAFILFSCGPTNFIKTSDVTWSNIELRDNITFDQAWNETIDVIAGRFEMEMISKDGAYARTGWIYTFNTKGSYTKNYRNRVIVKFSPDRTKVQIKAEAQKGSNGNWVNGFDSNLLKAIKGDIMGVVGRTTR